MTSTLLLAGLLAASPPQAADVILVGAPVYTLDAARSWAEALAIRGGRIVFVGSAPGASAFQGPRTRTVTLRGGMVLPAFQDAHAHALAAGIALSQCQLGDLPTADAILARIRSCAPNEAGAVVGGGWSLAAFAAGRPTKELLDSVVPDRPAYFSSSDGHSGWANSRMLSLAGISAKTPDPPPNGRIERTSDGEPQGTLQESAMALVLGKLPPPSREERRIGWKRAIEFLNQNGITAIQMPLDAESPPKGRETLETLRDAERAGNLHARVVVALETDPLKGIDQVDALSSLRQEFESSWIHPTAAKIFEDGIIESRTAAMLEPYADRGGDRGREIWPVEALNPFVERLTQGGFNIHVHAIGDRAVRLALDAFDAARRTDRRVKPRDQIAHLEVVQPGDVPRFRKLGVIANFQPLWAYPDAYVRDLTWPALGPERSRFLYPIGSIARSGAVVAFGSDWDVSSPNPLLGIQVAITREDPSEPSEALLPQEAIDLPAALAAYTIGAAFANGLEETTGSIEVGKEADIVVLSDNPFEVPPREIGRCRVIATILQGRPVYRDPSFPW